MDRIPKGLSEADMLAIEITEEPELPSSDLFEIIPEEDGAVVVDFDPTCRIRTSSRIFTSNLAEDMDDSDLWFPFQVN
jgi:hypothetical protein